MPRLTRTQKFADLRDSLTNDREPSLSTKELSDYEDRLTNITDILSVHDDPKPEVKKEEKRYDYNDPKYSWTSFVETPIDEVVENFRKEEERRKAEQQAQAPYSSANIQNTPIYQYETSQKTSTVDQLIADLEDEVSRTGNLNAQQLNSNPGYDYYSAQQEQQQQYNAPRDDRSSSYYYGPRNERKEPQFNTILGDMPPADLEGLTYENDDLRPENNFGQEHNRPNYQQPQNYQQNPYQQDYSRQQYQNQNPYQQPYQAPYQQNMNYGQPYPYQQPNQPYQQYQAPYQQPQNYQQNPYQQDYNQQPQNYQQYPYQQDYTQQPQQPQYQQPYQQPVKPQPKPEPEYQPQAPSYQYEQPQQQPQNIYSEPVVHEEPVEQPKPEPVVEVTPEPVPVVETPAPVETKPEVTETVEEKKEEEKNDGFMGFYQPEQAEDNKDLIASISKDLDNVSGTLDEPVFEAKNTEETKPEPLKDEEPVEEMIDFDAIEDAFSIVFDEKGENVEPVFEDTKAEVIEEAKQPVTEPIKAEVIDEPYEEPYNEPAVEEVYDVTSRDEEPIPMFVDAADNHEADHNKDLKSSFVSDTFDEVSAYNKMNGEQTIGQITNNMVNEIRHSDDGKDARDEFVKSEERRPVYTGRRVAEDKTVNDGLSEAEFEKTRESDEDFSNTVSMEISKIMDEISATEEIKVKQEKVKPAPAPAPAPQPVRPVRPVEPQPVVEEHPVMTKALEEEEEVVEIKNIKELEAQPTSVRDTLSSTIPFVVATNEEELIEDDEDDEEGSNTILNIILVVLIIVLVAVLGLIIFYILKTKGII